jgi:hypothetical protein
MMEGKTRQNSKRDEGFAKSADGDSSLMVVKLSFINVQLCSARSPPLGGNAAAVALLISSTTPPENAYTQFG